MIPILFAPEANPEALIDAAGIPLHDAADNPLYASGDKTTRRSFSTYGRGALIDCISCLVTEERNGEYELEMEYPATGEHFEEIEVRAIILAQANASDPPQAFRVYRISSPIDQVVTINAHHISYDLSGVPVLPFKATSAGNACAGLMSRAAIKSPFSIGTQIPTIADFRVDTPSSVRSWFGGKEGSLLDVYGGEWHYNNYDCTLLKDRGQDRGAVIRYGVNLIDFEQEKSILDAWTGLIAYWYAEEDDRLVQTSIIRLEGNFDHERILTLDLSSEFEEEPTAEQLESRAKTYAIANKISEPSVSLTIDWAQSGEVVELCDTVTVEFEKLGISTKAKCVRAIWDTLAERYTTLEIGDAKTNIVDTLAGIQAAEKELQTSVPTPMMREIKRATNLITGNSGGYVVVHTNDDGTPFEILVMDQPTIEEATKVWRWNQQGFGYSNSGYDGPYGTAITMDGAIVADFITAGILTGCKINNGNGTFEVDENGRVVMANASITGGTINIDTTTFADGIVLRNSDGSILSKLTARVWQILNGSTQAVVLSSAGTLALSSFLQCKGITNTGTLQVDGESTLKGRIKSIGTYNATASSGSYVGIQPTTGYLVRYSSSSRRYKHDITEDLGEDPRKLYKLPVVQFKYNDGYLMEGDQREGKDVIGFIAEDVAELMPGAVDLDDSGRPEMWNVHVVVPAMLKLIQEQKKDIDELKAAVQLLESHLLGR